MVALQLLNTKALSKAQAAAYRTYLNQFMTRWKNTAAKCPSTESVCYTPRGLAQSQYGGGGNLHWVAGAAFLALGYADHIDGLSSTARTAAGYAADSSKSHRCWARSQLRYMLGYSGHSYVIGWGSFYPKKPFHKSSSCSANYALACDWSVSADISPNPNVAFGGLVSGPDAKDAFNDARSNHEQNEPKLIHSAGLIGARQPELHRMADGMADGKPPLVITLSNLRLGWSGDFGAAPLELAQHPACSHTAFCPACLCPPCRCAGRPGKGRQAAGPPAHILQGLL
jgi:hypothetical protein